MNTDKGWQEIDTAPKDGTWILLGKQGEVIEGHWAARMEFWTYQDDAAIFDDPTHWQPLPEPPKDTAL